MWGKILPALLLVAAVAGLAWWWTRPNPVTRAASFAATPEQKRLWSGASSPSTSDALEKLGAPSGRQTSAAATATQPAQPAPQAPGSIPRGVLSEITIVSDLPSEPTEFSGGAQVADVDQTGERVVLQLDSNRQLAIVARVEGRPLGVARGDRVDVRFRWQPGRVEREQIIGVRTAAGVEILSAVRAGRQPVMLNAPLPSGGTFSAVQFGEPLDNALSLRIAGPGFEDQIGSGIERKYGNRSVQIIGSVARPGRVTDRAPYSVTVLTWRLQ